jgi:hypothetical protein
MGANSDWYEQAMARYAAAGVGEQERNPSTAADPTDPSSNAVPGWYAEALTRYGLDVPVGAGPTPGGMAASPSMVSDTVVKVSGAVKALVLSGLTLVGGGIGAFVALDGSTPASASIAQAVGNTLNAHTSDVAVQMTSQVDGQSFTVHATGAIDFDTSAMELSMQIDAGGQQIPEKLILDGGTVFMNMGPLVSYLLPGKDWVSLPVGGSTSGLSGSFASGDTDNPSAMLHFLAAEGNGVTSLGTSVVDGQEVTGYAVHMTQQAVDNEIAQEHLPSWMQQAVSKVVVPDETSKVYINDAGQLQSVVSDVDASVDGTNVVEQESEQFSNYGAPVSITDPPASDVAPFSQFLQASGPSDTTT